MNESSDDIKDRLPVWRAFSELFLDTELDDKDYLYIARICVDSPYSVKELEGILFNEVWPVLRFNLYSMAGNWSGWNDGFLISNISVGFRSKFCMPWWLNPAKRFFLKDAWNKVQNEINNQNL